MLNTYSRKCNSTFSNPDEVITTHIHLDWKLDFESKTLSGSVKHSVRVVVGGTASADFDSSKLHITSAKIDGESVSVTVGDRHESLGSKVSVEIPSSLRSKDSCFDITFEYSTDPEASAVQWLAKEATKGTQYPYVFTQCQAIHARSLLVCQDTPGVKSTYSANVSGPEWCTVLMSALADNTETRKGHSKWTQPVPMPSYLIALAGGNLASREISPRVRVWCEPEGVDAVAFEFSETEEFLSKAEDITCPYVWTRYDVLCLPPSFPYGGMENPCLTFATPTLIAGDKSLANVIAHEIAHSWTGNLVTNHTWEHFWLNEGWTVWLERKIMSRVKGDEYLKLSAQGGWKVLKDSISQMGADDRFTMLVWPLGHEDPDEAFSSVPYEKGFNLLNYLEGIVGTPSFELFAKAYLQNFKFSTVTSGEFRDFFVEYFNTSEYKSDILNLDWDQILHSPGMPVFTPDFSNSLSVSSKALAKRWIEFAISKTTPSGFTSYDMEGWSTQQILIFLEDLSIHSGENDSFTDAYLKSLDSMYSLTKCGNSEIKLRWQLICLQCDAEWIIPHVVEFITTQGRMKFVRPLYRALYECENGSSIALDTFEKFSAIYHPIARKMIGSSLKAAALASANN